MDRPKLLKLIYLTWPTKEEAKNNNTQRAAAGETIRIKPRELLFIILLVLGRENPGSLAAHQDQEISHQIALKDLAEAAIWNIQASPGVQEAEGHPGTMIKIRQDLQTVNTLQAHLHELEVLKCIHLWTRQFHHRHQAAEVLLDITFQVAQEVYQVVHTRVEALLTLQETHQWISLVKKESTTMYQSAN